jgi:hypothetical protein
MLNVSNPVRKTNRAVTLFGKRKQQIRRHFGRLYFVYCSKRTDEAFVTPQDRPIPEL